MGRFQGHSIRSARCWIAVGTNVWRLRSLTMKPPLLMAPHLQLQTRSRNGIFPSRSSQIQG